MNNDKAKLLLVDDSEVNRYTLGRLLRSAGWQVEEASNGHDALELVRAQPELVILDVNLPDMSGVEVCRRIKHDPATCMIPVLHVSATSIEARDAVAGLESGAEGYLVTPIEPTVLLATVRALLRAHRAEKAAAQSGREWQTAFDAIRDGVFLIDNEGIVRRCNRSGFELLESSSQQVLGAPWAKVAERLGMAAGSEKNRQLQEVLFRGKWLRVRFDEVGDHEHLPFSTTCVVTDVTYRKRSEEELRRVNRELDLASRAKSRFLANMSHELRTPLNAIIGYAEMLEEEALDNNDGRLAEDLGKIRTSARHLLELINGILDLSKIEAGKMTLNLGPFDVCELIHNAGESIRSLIEKNDNHLSVECVGQVGAMYADETKVRQILFNLLSNAAKFTHHGQVRLEAQTEKNGQGQWIVFSVSDTGSGIPAEETENLFRTFYQVRAPKAGQEIGSGLGLTISKQFCEMMGGEISVESKLGEGSVFRVRLPAHVSDARAKSQVYLQSE